nr:MAG: RNA dependent RNA polymerase [Picornaviridae sp.]
MSNLNKLPVIAEGTLEGEPLPNEKMMRRHDYRDRVNATKKHFRNAIIKRFRKCKEKRANNSRAIGPQSGFSLGGFAGRSFDYGPLIESFVILYFNIMSVTSVSGFVAAILSFVKQFYPETSLAGMLYAYLVETVGYHDVVPEAGIPDWLIAVKNMHIDWRAIVTNPAFKKISALLSMAMAVGILGASKVEMNVGALKVFSVEAMKGQAGAVDFIDAAWSTVLYFLEGGYTLFMNKSLSGFLFSNSAAMDFDQEFATLKEYSNYVSVGSLEKEKGITFNEYDLRLRKLIEKAEMIYRSMSPGPERSIIFTRTGQLRDLLAKFLISRATSKLKIAPYTFMILGESGVGKSTSTDIFLKYILSVNGFPSSPEYITTVDDQDKYYSTIKNHTTGIKRDDVANAPPAKSGESKVDLMILLANNQCNCLPSADVEEKGKKFPQPMVIGGNSNVREYSAVANSLEPVSVIRRWDIEIHQTVKPQFRKPGEVSIDKDAVYAKYGNKPDELTDIWLFTVYKVFIIPKNVPVSLVGPPKPHVPNQYSRYIVDFNGKPLQDVSLAEMFDFLKVETANHFKQQRAIVASADAIDTALVSCEVCGKVKQFCICPPPPSPPPPPPPPPPNGGGGDGGGGGDPPNNDDLPPLSNDSRFGDAEEDDYDIAPDLLPDIFCKGCGETFDMCDCSDDDESVSEITAESGFLSKSFKAFFQVSDYGNAYLIGKIKSDGDKFDELFANQIYKSYRQLCESRWSKWTTYLPTSWLEYNAGKDFALLEYREDIKSSIIQKVLILSVYIVMLAAVFFITAFRRDLFIPGFLLMSQVEYGNPRIYHQFYDFAWDQCKLWYMENWYPKLPWCIRKYFEESKMEIDYDFSYFTFYYFMSFLFFSCLYIGEADTFFWCMCACAILSAYVINLVLYYATIKEIEKQKLLRKLMDTRHAEAQTVFARVRDKYFQTALTMFIAGGIFYSAYKLWSVTKIKITEQADLAKPSVEDILEREKERKDDHFYKDWEKINLTPVPANRKCLPDELMNVLAKNLVYLEIDCGEYIAHSNALFIKSNFLLVPKHFVQEGTHIVKVVRKANPKGLCMNSTFKFTYNSKVLHQLPGHDLVLMYVANSGDFANIIDCFPNDVVDIPYLNMIHRVKEGGTVRTFVNDFKHCPLVTNGTEHYFSGGNYNTSFPTFRGLCCAVLFTESKPSCIAGLHLGGVVDGTRSVCAQLYKSEVEKALQEYAMRDGIINTANPGVLLTKQYGVEVLEPKPFTPQDTITHMKEGMHVEVYGKCIGKAHSKSAVVATVISKNVVEYMKCPQLWGPPKMKGKDGHSSYEPWRAHIDEMGRSSPGIDPLDLEWAVKDYRATLLDVLERQRDLWEERLKPLTRDENVNGRIGERFIEPIVMKTSVGAPLTGPKSEYATVEEYHGYIKRHLDNQFWEMYEHFKEEYRNNRRCYPLFKASLKDEPTLITKDKVRVFTGAPLAFQLIIREYFMPILQFLSYNPFETGVMVGINPIGPEWDKLAAHLTKFNDTNNIYIDFKRYDTRMPSQITAASLSLMIDIARASGNYSEDDLFIMNAMIADIVNPVVLHNGALLECHGFWCSGINLTAHGGSLNNGLYGRSCFHHHYPKFTGRYIDVAADATYGDDRNTNVDSNYSDYNNITFRDYLARFDVQVTSGRKDGVMEKYDKFVNTDFLKRRFRYDSDVGAILGPLSMTSIFKSLHAICESKVVTNRVVSAGNIDGALSEFFLHGRGVYEEKREQLKQVAAASELTDLCRTLNLDYDAKLLEYKEKYYNQNNPLQQQDEGFKESEYEFWGEW